MNPEESLSKIKVVGVIGAGGMGNQIAELMARIGGYKVNIVDINIEFVNKGLAAIDNRLEKFFVAKGKMSAEEKKNLTSRIKGTAKIEEAVKDADFVIEAVIENMALKKDIFKKLDEFSMPHTILASNTSYLNITEMASATKKPDKVAGMHFFNPVAMMKLVEVVTGSNTSQETAEMVRALSIKLGKEPVMCHDFSYGFLANQGLPGSVDRSSANGMGAGCFTGRYR